MIFCKPSLFTLAMLFDFFAAVFSTVSSVRLAIFTQNVIDGKYIAAIQVELVNLVLFLIAIGADYFYRVFQNKTIQNGMLIYRDRISDSIMHTDKDASAYISALNTDSSRIESGIRNVFVVSDALMYMVISLLALIYIHWAIMLVSVGLFLMNSIVPVLEKNASEKAEKKSSYLQKEYLEKSTDIINGKFVWSAYNCLKVLQAKLTFFAKQYEGEIVHVKNKQSLLNEFPTAVSVIVQTLLNVFTIYMILNGAVIPGVILSVGNVSGTFFNNISNLLAAKNQMNGYNAVFREKIAFDEKQEITEKKLDHYTIKMHDVRFSYDNNIVILNGFSHVFESGKKYLLLGETGCGKSTLLKLLFKSLQQYSGEICIGGYEYSKISCEQLYTVMGFITQDSYVFDDTALNNITLGRNIDETTIQHVLHDAKIDDTFNTNENAKSLSGGQIQRVCLARELVEYHPIVLMDEVANAVGEETAKQIYDLFLNSDRTVIAVAHYLPAGVKEKFDEIIEL